MADVVLIHAPITFDYSKSVGDQTSSPPIGLLYIASYLEKNKFSVKLYDPAPQKLTLEKLLDNVAKDKPRVVGISAVTFGVRTAVQMAKAMKERFGKKIVIGLGGMHISTDPTFIKRFPYFDFGVIGEGEIEMCKIVKKIFKGGKIHGIYKAEVIKNLDELPFPAWHLFDPKDYFSPHEGKKEGAKLPATMISSRGCPFNCTFCSKPINRARYRVRSGKNVVDEMEAVYDLCGGVYGFMCDTMTLFKEKTLEMCDEIIKRKLKVKWVANTRVDLFNEELAKRMAKAGCTSLFFGVESGNPRIRNEVAKKNITDKQIMNAIKWCWEYGIQSNIYMMVGFPTETWKELWDTINFPILSGADVIGVHITWPQPGSILYDEAIRDGIISKTVIDDFVKDELSDDPLTFWPVYVPEGLTLQDLIKAKKIAYRNFYLRPSWFLKRVRWYFRKPEKFFQDCGEIKTAMRAILTGSTGTAET